MIIVHQEEIIEITPHGFRRTHGRIKIELLILRERRELLRQDRLLYLTCHVQVVLYLL